MNVWKRVSSFILSISLLCTASAAVAAGGNASVLTHIGHSAADTVPLSASERHVTLTVPHGYPHSFVDLADGLDIGFDETRYKAVVAVSAGTAVVDDDAGADVSISYLEVGEDDGAEKSVTVYTVRVVRATAVQSCFSGVVHRRVKAGKSITFSPVPPFSDPSNIPAHYVKNDGQDVGHYILRGSNLVTGTLRFKGADAFAAAISPDELGSLTFEAKAEGEASYYIDAYDLGSNLVGTALLTVTVYDTPSVLGRVTGSVYRGAEADYFSLGFPDSFDLRGDSLVSLELTPGDADCGVWYLGDSPLAAGVPASIPAAKVGLLSFQGTAAGTAAFSWRVSNAAGFSDMGTGVITVPVPSPSLFSYSSPSPLTRGGTQAMSPSHFKHTPSSAPLTFIKILSVPTASDGYICLSAALAKDTALGYPAIAAGAALRVGAVIPWGHVRHLQAVSKPAGTGASLSFSWTATTDATTAEAIWASPASYSIDFMTAGTVFYDADINLPLALSASDFASQFRSATGSSLSHVVFTPPAKTVGALYYNYSLTDKKGTSVTASAKYYTGTSPNLSALTFVPAADYTGPVEIKYSAFRTDGLPVAGKLLITVSNSSAGTFSYMTDKNSPVHLDAAHFSSAFASATGRTLSHVRFILPSASQGKLYYDYLSPSDYESSVLSSDRYQVYESPYLSYVAFVPAQNYTGTVTLRYTAYDSGGSSYSGKLIVYVVDSPAGIVSYPVRVNGAATLSGEDFADEFISVSGSVLSHVVFTPPPAAVGAMYTEYSADTGKGKAVTAATKYYNGAKPDISDIVFVPASDFAGTAEVKYTVYTAAGTPYAGKLKFIVGEGTSGTVSLTTDYNTPLTLRASDFSRQFYSGTGSALSAVVFTLPSAEYGRFYYNYTSFGQYDAAVYSAVPYYLNTTPYISGITFVPKSGYAGTFSVPYIGFAADGTGYSGKMQITVGGDRSAVRYESPAMRPITFDAADFAGVFSYEMDRTLYYVRFSLPDASYGRLYYDYTSDGDYSFAVTSSASYYVSSYPGISRVTFVPNKNFTGTVTIGYTGYSSGGSVYSGKIILTYKDYSYHPFPDLAGYSWAEPAIAYLYNRDIVTGSEGRFSPDSRITRGDFALMIYRAFDLRIAFAGNFVDVPAGSYYYDAIAAAKALGIAQGSGGRFYPADPLTRQDAMALVARAMSAVGRPLPTAPAGTLSKFHDAASVSDYAANAVASLVRAGIITGDERGRLNPKSTMGRAEMAVILYRVLTA